MSSNISLFECSESSNGDDNKTYFLLLCLAAEIRTYPKPTANPNASGIKTTPPSQFNACWIKVSNISIITKSIRHGLAVGTISNFSSLVVFTTRNSSLCLF